MGKSSPKPASTQVVQTKTEIPEWFKPYMEDVFSEAQSITGIGTGEGPAGYEAAPGKSALASIGERRLADVDPYQTEALEEMGTAYDTAQTDIGEAVTATKEGAKGIGDITADQFQQTYMNPFQQAVTDITIREEQRRAAPERQRLAAMAAKAGAYGGSRAALMESEFDRNLNQRLSDIQGRGDLAAYQTGLQQMNVDKQRQLMAAQQQAGLGTQRQQALMAGLQGKLGAGAQRRGLGQQAIDVGYGQFLEEREFPKENLGFYSGLIRGYQPPPARYAQTQTMSPYSGVQAGIGMAGALGSMGKGFGLFNKGGIVKLAFGGTPNQGYTEEMGTQQGLAGMMSGPMRFQNQGAVPSYGGNQFGGNRFGGNRFGGNRFGGRDAKRHQRAIAEQKREDALPYPNPIPPRDPRYVSDTAGKLILNPNQKDRAKVDAGLMSGWGAGKHMVARHIPQADVSPGGALDPVKAGEDIRKIDAFRNQEIKKIDAKIANINKLLKDDPHNPKGERILDDLKLKRATLNKNTDSRISSIKGIIVKPEAMEQAKKGYTVVDDRLKRSKHPDPKPKEDELIEIQEDDFVGYDDEDMITDLWEGAEREPPEAPEEIATKLAGKEKGDKVEPEWFKMAGAFASLIPGREKNWSTFTSALAAMDSPEKRKEALAKAEYYGGEDSREKLKALLKNQTAMNKIYQKDRVLQKDLMKLQHEILRDNKKLNVDAYGKLDPMLKTIINASDFKKLKDLDQGSKEYNKAVKDIFAKAHRRAVSGPGSAKGGTIPPELAKHGVTGLRSL